MTKPARKCHCGRRRSEVPYVVQRTNNRRLLYFRCQCGFEWTEVEAAVELNDPVSSDEILAVREALDKLEGPLAELLE